MKKPEPSLGNLYWSHRYRNNQTGWDIGSVSPPIRDFIDGLTDKNMKILIPGAGNAYEAEYLHNNGFSNVFVVDIAEDPLLNLKSRCPGFPDNQLLNKDFFEIQGEYDLILEQTFFCALPVSRRISYAKKTHDLLHENGEISGVLFNFELTEKGPPFGGSKEEYLEYFRPFFEIKKLEPCYNSIAPRQGNEFFFRFKKKMK